MAQIERKETITYKWWNEELKEISSEHQEALEEVANEHIAEMKANGYTSGQLTENINDVEYVGWWEMTTVVP